jgi:hypothetical protein
MLDPFKKLTSAVELVRRQLSPAEAAALGKYRINGNPFDNYGVVSESFPGQRFSELHVRDVTTMSEHELAARIKTDWGRWRESHPPE